MWFAFATPQDQRDAEIWENAIKPISKPLRLGISSCLSEHGVVAAFVARRWLLAAFDAPSWATATVLVVVRRVFVVLVELADLLALLG